MPIVKRLLFFILAPIFAIPMAFLALLQGVDKHGKGWYDRVWTEGNMFELFFAVWLFIPYIICTYFLWMFEEYWEKLAE